MTIFPLRIRCHRCDRPVDQVVTEYDIPNMRWVVTAYCHGDREEMELVDELLNVSPDLAEQLRNQEGVAFSRRRIGGKQ